MSLRVLNLKKAMTAEESELKRITANLYAVPRIKPGEYEFGDDVDGALLNRVIRGKSGVSMSLMKFGQQSFLTVTERKNSTSNVHFVNLDTKVTEFTILDAELLLDVSTKNEKPETVTFLRGNSIIKMKWGTKPTDVYDTNNQSE